MELYLEFAFFKDEMPTLHRRARRSLGSRPRNKRRTHTHVHTLVILLSNKCRARDEEGNGVGRRVSRARCFSKLSLAHKRPASCRCMACIIVLYFLTATPWHVAIDPDADRRSLSSDNRYRVFEFNRVT